MSRGDVMRKFSILIATWNGDDLLKDCLDSIARVYADDLPQIVVVDNANQASTAKLTTHYRNVKYLSAPENLGFAGGNNLGWPHCGSEYVVLLNNDTTLQGDSISPIIDYMGAHSKCAAVQGTIVFDWDRSKTDGTGMWWSPIGILAPEGFLRPLAEAPKEPREVFAAGGAFFVARRSAVEKAGGLFYDHFKSYYEEVNLCHRLWLAGYECAYVPTLPVYHKHSVTAGKIGWDAIRNQYYRNIWFSTLTCFGWYGILRFVPFLFALRLGQSLMMLIKGKTSGVKVFAANLRHLIGMRQEIVATRRQIRKLAVISDFALFNHAVRSQPWRYYWNLIKNN